MVEVTKEIEKSKQELSHELRSAARRCDIKEVLRTLKDGADVNATGVSELTALMYAAGGGHVSKKLYSDKDKYAEIARVLIEHGADVEKSCTTGHTAAMFAAENGNLDIIDHIGEKRRKEMEAYLRSINR